MNNMSQNEQEIDKLCETISKKWLDKNQTPIDTKQLVLMMKNEGTSLEEIIIILKKML